MAPRSSKVLRETDVKKRYSVPTGFLSSLPSFNGGHAVDFQAVDGSGRVWPFRCSVRKKGHPKPVISRGWRAFVDSKGLKVGDKVRFYKKNEAGANNHAYEVRAEKEIKIFGVVLGYPLNFFFQTKPTDDRGEDAPSRQKKSEIRMAPRRRKTTTEVVCDEIIRQNRILMQMHRISSGINNTATGLMQMHRISSGINSTATGS
ncbi:hypothetical protein OIU76_022874 [Salix suchowensis]|nr:hypothetical protein OIU76_022874 [Salix suchowensis]